MRRNNGTYHNGVTMAEKQIRQLESGEWRKLIPQGIEDAWRIYIRRQLGGGFGGWGCEVVRMWMDKIATDPEAQYTRPMYFEIDSTETKNFPSENFLYMGDVRALEILTEMVADSTSYPEFRPYIGDPAVLLKAIKGSDDPSIGAGQLYQFGMLIGLYNLDRKRVEIDRILNAHMIDLFDFGKNSIFSAMTGQHQADFAQPLTLWMVTSLVGGTGSATYQNVSYYIHQNLSYSGAKNKQAVAVLSGPGAFPEVHNKSPLYINAVHGFQYIWRAYENPKPPAITLSQSYQLDRSHEPFVITYYVDGINKNHYRFPRNEDVSQAVAHTLAMITTGVTGKAHGKYVTNEIRHTTHPNLLSSFGSYTLVFERDGFVEKCRHWMSVDVKRETFMRPQPSSEAAQLATVEAYLKESGITQLHDAFMETSTGRSLEVPSISSGRGRKELVRSVGSARRKQSQTLPDELTISAEVQRTAQIEFLQQYIERLVNLPGGLQAAIRWLQALGTRLIEFKQELESRVEQRQTHAMQRADVFKQQQNQAWYRRGRQRANYENYAEGLLQDEYHHAILLPYIAVVAAVIAEIEHQLPYLEQVLGELGEFVDQLDIRAQAVALAAEKRPLVVESILNPVQERQLYEKYKPAILAELLENPPQLTWDGSTWVLRYPVSGGSGKALLMSEESFEWQLTFCGRGFGFMKQWGIEEVAVAMNLDIQELVAALIERSAPWVSLKLTKSKLPPSLIFLATPKGADGIFGEMVLEGGVDLLASGDDTKIEIFNSIHGFHWRDLSYADAMIRAYESEYGALDSDNVSHIPVVDLDDEALEDELPF